MTHLASFEFRILGGVEPVPLYGYLIPIEELNKIFGFLFGRLRGDVCFQLGWPINSSTIFIFSQQQLSRNLKHRVWWRRYERGWIIRNIHRFLFPRILFQNAVI